MARLVATRPRATVKAMVAREMAWSRADLMCFVQPFGRRGACCERRAVILNSGRLVVKSVAWLESSQDNMFSGR
jgi:hypothetical protein